MTRQSLAACLLAACALAAAGCGGGSDSTATTEPITFEQLAQSASTSAKASTGRFSFDMALEFPGTDEPFSLSGEGAFDEEANRASFAVDMSSFAKLLGGFFAGLAGSSAQGSTQGAPDFDDPTGWKIEVVQDGEVGYVRFPALDDQLPEGKSWIRSDGDTVSTGFDFGQFEQFAQSDPRDVLESLQGITTDVEVVGTETLRGASTTHYRAVVDPQELAKKAPQNQGEKSESLVDQLTAQSGVSEILLDVWIDDAGLVRKLSMAVSASDATAGPSGDASLAFELWDYDEPVAIELPPASEVVDASDVRR